MPLTDSYSILTWKLSNLCHFKTLWTGEGPTAWPLSRQDKTIQNKMAYIHSSSRILMFQRPKTARVIPRGYSDRLVVGDVLKMDLEGRKDCE
jgi:hypothetical protein